MIKLVVKCGAPRLATALGSTAFALLLAGASTAIAAPATMQLAQAGSIVTLQPPHVADYWMSATRQPGGVVVFDGYVPNEATRSRLSTGKNADTNYLKLGTGAPERYQSAVDFGLLLLQRLAEGRFSLRGTTVTLSGIARSSADYEALDAIIAEGAPQGVILTVGDIKAPLATTYAWSANKEADGKVALAGMVPDPASKAILADTAAHPSVSAITYASGEPTGFLASATTALNLLQHLQTGKAAYTGTSWTLSGVAANTTAKAAIDADFVAGKLAAAGWSLDIAVAAAPAKPKPAEPVEPPKAKPQPTPPAAEPAPPAPQPAVPAVDPAYTFSAMRAADGAVTMSGQLPADPALRFFAVITGAPATGVTIAGGAPDDFILSAEAGLRALMELDNAQLRFADGKWSLSGKAADAAASAALTAAIAVLPSGAAWTLSITAPSPLDACQADVAAFSARNAILFNSAAATIAPDSEPALDELARYLALCPQADIDVEGHTDADGDDAQNLALSVARAEAVVNALIARNIAPTRLYAIGYGESMPVADNTTSAGKRLNRRIVVNVLQHHLD